MSAAIAAAFVGAGASVYGAVSSKKASDKAASRHRDAASQNVRFLQQQGARGATAVRLASEEAMQVSRDIPKHAIDPLRPFVDIGGQAFNLGREQVLSGGGSDPFRRAIAEGGREAVRGSAINPYSGDVQRGVQKHTATMGQRYDPFVRQQLLGLGTGVGFGTARDIAGILGRGKERLGNIERGQKIQEASALIGQVPEISAQMQSGQEARLLGEIGQTNFIADMGTNLADLAGGIYGARSTNPLQLPSGPQSKLR